MVAKKTYNFDKIADRSIDFCRKWDYELINRKYPGTPKDFIPMWIADMDFQTAPKINASFMKLSQNGAYGYTHPIAKFYESIVTWHKMRHDVHVEKDWITLSYGTVSTLHYIYQEFCNADDAIIINTPVYDPFSYAAEHNNITVINNPLICRDNRYYFDLDHFEKLCEKYRPKLFILCSPHNPSGRIWSKKELEAISDICLENQVIMVVDEVHSEMIIEGEYTPYLSLDQKYMENAIMVTSPNKAFNLGGLKTSYSIIPNVEIRERLRERFKKNSITSPNVFGLIGLITAYEQCGSWLDEVTKYIKSNYLYLVSRLEDISEFTLMKMESSYLPWINIHATGYHSDELTLLLAQKAGVVVEPGSNYSDNGDHYIRLNIGTSRSLIVEAIDRIESCIKIISK